AYHCVAPLDAALVGGLRKSGWEAVTIMDYSVPWDDFAKFDLIILSREGREYTQFYRDRDANPPNRGTARWLTPAQEQKFEDYVNAGGKLFHYHDGFSYPKGNAISRVARSFFVRHPQIVNINVTTTGKMPALTEGITPFTVADEEYQVEMDESQTSVFLESHSPEHGRAPQGWAHTYGKGKVAVLIPGHNAATINHPMMLRCQQNIIGWLTA
ncbi:MAG: ThuA domain-containing protein, partial [Candidatus Solibacter sp.]|nr:ThuA domain-containing protein [Candidatus Solibacter sp.]